MSALAPVDAAKTDANGWLPIETAPKDGSESPVWFPSQKEVGYGFYVEADYGYPATFRFFWFEVEESADLNQLDELPSHWQHLPKPPVSLLPGGAAACAADSPAGSTSSPIPSGTNSPSDGDAFAEVKGRARLANAAGVDPSPSDIVMKHEDIRS